MNRILQGDVLSFAKHYKGEKFHALLCDAPYHLTSITDRFSKEDATPAQEGNDGAFKRLSTGFMGKSWDGGDIAFRPETWRAFWNLLYPGAFGMTFGGSRTAHRMAVAIEDAGYNIHPKINWCFGSGFPKSTRIDAQIDRAVGAKREKELYDRYQDGRKRNTKKYEGKIFDGTSNTNYRERATTDLAKIWEGHRYGLQCLKPAAEDIIVFQKPYEGKPVDDITRTGAGALNIDGGRIGYQSESDKDTAIPGGRITTQVGSFAGRTQKGEGKELDREEWAKKQNGRWPSNFIIQHSPDCKRIGTSPDGYTINRFTDGAKPFGDAVGEDVESEEIGGESAVWECVDGCPARELDWQSGHLKSGELKGKYIGWGTKEIYGKGGEYHRSFESNSGGASRFFFNADYAYENLENAAPFYYQAKAGKKERNAGLGNQTYDIGHNTRDICANCGGRIFQNKDRPSACNCDNQIRKHEKVRNPHPTLKPIALIKHLATLLLPPDEYAPRRLFNPFSGTGSEMIGAHQAGWEHIIGVEKESEYVDIAKARISYWERQGIQLPLFTKEEK